ncbi:hypothetical protein BGZ70_002145 [Mortierella alpina]|uniref:FAD-binding domain-containing protein n=1 Tax=Mortierella alpina TaxID=64518 RepID=A0A9P6IXW3_MORAP|nr:hypothetical protein BGZ70_002145 [Mortierella alpina]
MELLIAHGRSGSGMSLGPNILPLFEQLGMLEDIYAISRPAHSIDMHVGDGTFVGGLDMSKHQEWTGYPTIIFHRPQLHSLMLSKLALKKIHYSKRVLSTGQNENGVLIRCQDGTTYEGDILVGADGAYSAVRQSLYEQLDKMGCLPQSDSQTMLVGHSCLVGTTNDLDEVQYPVVKGDTSHFAVLVADDLPHSVTLNTVPGNRICWAVRVMMDGQEKDTSFRNSEWGPESIESMVKQVSHHKIPFGGTLGDLIEATPKNLISRVFLEEKCFETWHHQRTVLLGDACHKMLPSGGQGATNAMQDAVVLANGIYDLQSTSLEDVEAALKDYRQQRYAHAKQQVDRSAGVGRVMHGRAWFARFVRNVILNWMPASLEKMRFSKAYAYRPQAVFLPLAENRGEFQVLPQRPSKREVKGQTDTSN